MPDVDAMADALLTVRGVEVIIEDTKVVGGVEEDCLVFDEEVTVDDNKVVWEVDEDCWVLDEEAIVEDNTVVCIRVVLLYTPETAQQDISVGFNRLHCVSPTLRHQQLHVEDIHTPVIQ